MHQRCFEISLNRSQTPLHELDSMPRVVAALASHALFADLQASRLKAKEAVLEAGLEPIGAF